MNRTTKVRFKEIRPQMTLMNADNFLKLSADCADGRRLFLKLSADYADGRRLFLKLSADCADGHR
jgi:hypothetical protein